MVWGGVTNRGAGGGEADLSFGAKIFTTNQQRRRKKEEKIMKNRTTQMINEDKRRLTTSHNPDAHGELALDAAMCQRSR